MLDAGGVVAALDGCGAAFDLPSASQPATAGGGVSASNLELAHPICACPETMKSPNSSHYGWQAKAHRQRWMNGRNRYKLAVCASVQVVLRIQICVWISTATENVAGESKSTATLKLPGASSSRRTTSEAARRPSAAASGVERACGRHSVSGSPAQAASDASVGWLELVENALAKQLHISGPSASRTISVWRAHVARSNPLGHVLGGTTAVVVTFPKN